MMSNTDRIWIFFSICMGFLMALVVINFFPGTMLKSARNAIAECEKSLPRDQHCIISAIPDPQNEQ